MISAILPTSWLTVQIFHPGCPDVMLSGWMPTATSTPVVKIKTSHEAQLKCSHQVLHPYRMLSVSRFEITDADGLHQAQLLIPAAITDPELGANLQDCKSLSGQSNTIEFITTALTTKHNTVWLSVIDVYGNSTSESFPIDTNTLLPAEFVVSIPDANLARVVREALGLAPSDAITQLGMLELTRLTALSRNIADLTGLEQAINLVSLNLWANQISDVRPLAGLTNLTDLNLGANSISDISPLVELINLTQLNLLVNNISNISPVAELTNLADLKLGSNLISDISAVAGLTQLIGLELSDNNISDLSPLVANAGLGSGDTVKVRGNSLSYELIHTHIPTLQSRGVMVEFDNRVPTTLSNISGVITDSDNVLTVEVRDNNGRTFEGVPVTFTVTSGGGTLSVTSTTTDEKGRAQSTLTLGSDGGANRVTVSAVGTDKTAIFSDVPGVVENVNIPDPTLRAAIEEALGVTPGSAISPEQMATLTNFEANLGSIGVLIGLEFATNLERLTLASNEISDISVVAGLTNLSSLDLWNNSISDISAVKGLTNLTYLQLGANSISDISALAGLTNLTFLGLYHNNISDVSTVAGLTNLTLLSLERNTISDLSPLVANTGLGGGDTVYVLRNPLSYQSIHTHIPTLQSRGVTVKFDNQAHPALLKISGDNQKGMSSASLSHPFVVEAQDENGAALAGISVTFTVTGGDGTLSVANTITDENGRAQSTLTLGSNPGTNTVEVSVDGISQTAVFSAEATPPLPMPTTLEYISGDNQSGLTGEALSHPFVVEVQDENGDPLEGVTVTFVVGTGGGALSDTSVDTGADGLAQSTLTLGSDPGTNTVEVSVEGIAEMVTFTALAEIEFNLSVPAGISLIHVPLKASTVDGVAQTITSIGDLYDALGGASKVTFLITYDSQAQEWRSYFGPSDTGTPADRALTDDTGIIAGMITPASIRLTGNPLGTNGSSSITLNPGLNLVGLPLRDSRVRRVSHLFALDGIGDNVPVIILTDNGEFKAVGRARDPGDIPIIGGQSFIMTAQRETMVTISGDGWYNTSAMAAAPPIALTGIEVKDTTPVLALRGSIVDEEMGTNRTGFRVIVKNLSTGRAVAAVTKDENYSRSDKRKSERVGYQVTVVDVETGRAARIGDRLEISVRAPSPLIGVQPLQYTVTAEDVKQSLIQLPTLVTYEIPAETQLLANYPNPFNPETWIPYRLAEDAFVTLTIYDLSGQVVRALEVGHQIAAVYEGRSKAVYWDGRNKLGESVASGVYFYTLTAGDYSATRKMVILK